MSLEKLLLSPTLYASRASSFW